MVQTETISPRYRGLDTWSDEDILDAFWEGQSRAIAAVRAALPDISKAAQAIVSRIGDTGRMIYVGAGSSGRQAALDGAELGSTFGWPDDRVAFVLAEGPVLAPGAAGAKEDDAARARTTMLELQPTPSDVVVAVAASGTTPFTIAAAEAARERGALVIAIANNDKAPLFAQADVPILLRTGVEIISGSTRMNAGTGHKAALGLLSSLTMTRLGHVHDGLMVSLRVENAKLRDRAASIIADITGCSPETAIKAFDQSGKRIKVAALIVRGAEAGQAEKTLAECGGNLRAALGRIG
jgi:N-acetylmuramic acid 6-phosphate etherase